VEAATPAEAAASEAAATAAKAPSGKPAAATGTTASKTSGAEIPRMHALDAISAEAAKLLAVKAGKPVASGP
jgi:hypothetical protein